MAPAERACAFVLGAALASVVACATEQRPPAPAPAPAPGRATPGARHDQAHARDVHGAPLPPAVPTAAPGPLQPSIGKLMQERLNPALSKISFNLFHADEPDHDVIAERALAMAAMADELSRGGPDESWKSFVVQLKTNSAQLAEAANERNRESELHWFWHMRTSCKDCHDVYRFDEPEEMADERR